MAAIDQYVQILVINANEIIAAERLVMYLRGNGYYADSAHSLESAQTAFSAGKYRVLVVEISDIRSPLVAWLQELRWGAHHVRILITSAYPTQAIVNLAIELYAEDLFVPPADPVSITRGIDASIARIMRWRTIMEQAKHLQMKRNA